MTYRQQSISKLKILSDGVGKKIAIIYRFNKLVFDQGGNEFVNRPTHNYGVWLSVPVCYLFNKRYINVLPTDCGRW
jgi:hypothetical protein